MKSFLIPTVLVAALCACGHAFASAQLAQEKQCMQCHSIEKDSIGPSFRKIGAIYRTMRDPEGSLIDMMRMGSNAHLGSMWGKARMPDSSERPLIDDAEAKQLARWILELP